MNHQKSTSDLNTEPNTIEIYKAGLFLPREHIFCYVDSITEEHELIEDIVLMRMSAYLHVELIS